MLTPSFLSSLVKVSLVGGMMAGGAGAFYFVAANRPGNDDTSQVVAATATTVHAVAAPSATSTPPPDLSVVATPPPGSLTDTGYLAIDGSPLYAECVQSGLALPPTYSTPVGIALAPTPLGTPDSVTPPAGDKLPNFDLRTLEPPTRGGWAFVTSRCYGYSVQIPPTWVIGAREQPIGYQQGETTSLGVSNRVSLLVQYVYTAADLMDLNQSALGAGVYLLDVPLRTTFHSHDAIEAYVFDDSPLDGSETTAIVLRYTVRVRGSWWANIVATLYEPYDQVRADELRGVLDSVVFP